MKPIRVSGRTVAAGGVFAAPDDFPSANHVVAGGAETGGTADCSNDLNVPS